MQELHVVSRSFPFLVHEQAKSKKNNHCILSTCICAEIKGKEAPFTVFKTTCCLLET